MALMRVGIFGGTFNPMHFGHLVLAEQAFEKLKLDKVVFVPNFCPPLKNISDIARPSERFTMVKLAIAGNSRFAISNIEMKRKGRSYLIDTLRALKSRHAKAQLFFISGSDVSEEIAHWKSIDTILKLATFVIAKRPGYRLKKYNRNIKVISITELDISSSMIRRKIATDQSVRYLMPRTVYEYIQNNHLYQ